MDEAERSPVRPELQAFLDAMHNYHNVRRDAAALPDMGREVVDDAGLCVQNAFDVAAFQLIDLPR